MKENSLRWRKKKVINLLKKKTMKAKELIEETEIPKKSLYRILEELNDLGLAEKREKDGCWIWYEYQRSYSNPFMYEIAITHSKELLPGFAALLETNPHALLSYRNYKEKGDKPVDMAGETFTDENSLKTRIKSYRFSEFLEEHLQIEYPDIYNTLIKFRKVATELEKLKQSEGGRIVKKLQDKIIRPDHVTILEFQNKPSTSWFRKVFPEQALFKRNVPYVLGPFESIEEMNSLLDAYESSFEMKKKWYAVGPVQVRGVENFNSNPTQNLMMMTYRELATKLLLLKMQIESGRPLGGHCRLCPNIIIDASSSA